jgi:hypothetical protein
MLQHVEKQEEQSKYQNISKIVLFQLGQIFNQSQNRED